MENANQICYYNSNKKDKSLDRFLALRKQNAGETIIFEIKNIIDEANSGEIDYYQLSNELSQFNNGRSYDNRKNFKRSIPKPSSTDHSSRRLIRKKPKCLA